MKARFICCQERRLRVVKQAGQLNGIEYLEVAITAETDPQRQRTLFVRLLQPVGLLDGKDVRIDGGERIRTIGVQWAKAADTLSDPDDQALAAGLDDPDHVLVVRTVESGDFSYYTLHIDAPGFDPVLASVEFTFKVDCDSGFDCRDVCVCGVSAAAKPELDYLAKDYASLRRLLLDRLSLISPRWRERSPADLGVALVELLAYEGDRLSYRQDAIATEPYLGTARSRISVRRHARLVDYRMHDGCSARVLLRCTVEGEVVKLPSRTKVYSKVPGLQPKLDTPAEDAAVAAGAIVFETVDAAVLYSGHHKLDFYTWGDTECCLPAGSTSATLEGDWPNLKAGDILIFAEEFSPATGLADDADPTRRCAVRLTHVIGSADPSGGQFRSPKTNNPVPVTEIVWDNADALPFPVCVSTEKATEPVSVAWGNIVVADHGRSLRPEAFDPVPEPHLSYPDDGQMCGDKETDNSVPQRFRPRLKFGPLTRSVQVTPKALATTDPDAAVLADLAIRNPSQTVRDWLAKHGVVFRADPVVRGGDGTWSVGNGETIVWVREGTGPVTGKLVLLDRHTASSRVVAAAPQLARPQIKLTGKPPAGVDVTWDVRWDLLASGPNDTDFVVESEHDDTVYLRFGDGIEDRGHGRRPEPGTEFTARYRIGNGVDGNVGAHTLEHVATTSAVAAVTNPLPAAGGHMPETAEEVRRDAPEAYLVQERAVTQADWADVATRDPQIQRAAATWRWTGSWHTVFLTVDRIGGSEVDAGFERDQRARLERYRLAGYDLELDGPRYVPLELGLHVCIGSGHLRGAVRRELLAALGPLFQADRLTFAQPVFLSPVYAAAQAVPGVTSVNVHTFCRRSDPMISGVNSGVLTMSRLEIARLDNNPNFPEHGVLTLTIGGGR